MIDQPKDPLGNPLIYSRETLMKLLHIDDLTEDNAYSTYVNHYLERKDFYEKVLPHDVALARYVAYTVSWSVIGLLRKMRDEGKIDEPLLNTVRECLHIIAPY